MAKWLPLTQLNINDQLVQSEGDAIIIVANSLGESWSGKLTRCGTGTLELDRGRGAYELIAFANRGFQFQMLSPPPLRVFKKMEDDLFSRRSPAPPDLRDSESRE